MTRYLYPEPRVRLASSSRGTVRPARAWTWRWPGRRGPQARRGQQRRRGRRRRRLPIEPAARDWFTRHSGDATLRAMTGGDDYELLLAVRPRARRRLARTRHAGIPLTRDRRLHGRPRGAAAVRPGRPEADSPLPGGAAISDDSSDPPTARRWMGTLSTSTTPPSGRRRVRPRRLLRLAVPGLHTLLGLAFAFLLNFNRGGPSGRGSNLPWIIAPYFAFTTMVIGARPGTPYPRFRQQVSELFELCPCSTAILAPSDGHPLAVSVAVSGRVSDWRRGPGVPGIPAGPRFRHEPQTDTRANS
jgi:hypothetical protein